MIEPGFDCDILDEKFVLIKKIGDGATADVWLAHSVNDVNIKCAVKILKTCVEEKFKNNFKHFKREIEMLRRITNTNIINILDGKSGGLLKKNDGELERVDYLALELADNGELFDYIFHPRSGFGEDYARFIFTQMMNGLNSCHMEGVVHRDLKTENIMMNKDWMLKIADFGYATLKNGNDNDNILYSFLGTLSYAAPEILNRKPYNGTCADIYSSGIILFILVTGKLPFTRATLSDPEYRDIMAKNYELYWQRKRNTIGEFSFEFMSLINLMVAHDPSERPTINEIQQHPWMKLAIPNEKQVSKEFERRRVIVNTVQEFEQTESARKEMERKLAEMGTQSMKGKFGAPNRVYKSGDIKSINIINYIENDSQEELDSGMELDNDLELEQEQQTDNSDFNSSSLTKFINIGNNFCKFKVKGGRSSAKYVLQRIISFFYDDVKIKKQIDVNKKTLEVSVTYESDTDIIEAFPELKIEKLKLSVELKEFDSEFLICEVFKNSGDKVQFYEIYDQFVEYFNSK